MSLDHLPANIEQDVRQFASLQHISRDEAVVKLIETGLSVAKSKSKPATQHSQAQVVTEALSKIQQVRGDRAKELATLSTRSETAGELIGFLKDEPEAVEAIRQATHERRAAMYGP